MKEITFYLKPGSSADGDWRKRAACREVTDPDLFFPVGTTGPALDQIGAAKAICEPCPVKKSCLDWALTTHQDIGVWGGLSEDERKIILRERRQPNYGRQPTFVRG